ncbi:hypothetical protein HPB51_004311 [Rhipicephalus microplus]|uniref:Uncharacterized protein n=1 Tax=Rhipicephalus microplus TaxID=6941 RepID=A0A9J6EL50_RHIMP|nr:hypothetical protein HPB51_004311 [Rhipicephalus microplus]
MENWNDVPCSVGLGMLAVLIISCCSLAGLVIVPFLSHALYHRHSHGVRGPGCGLLLGSAVFHLIPQAFNLLGQDREHDYLWKSLIVFVGVYLFYLSDKVMRFIADYRQENPHRERSALQARNFFAGNTSASHALGLQNAFSPTGGVTALPLSASYPEGNVGGSQLLDGSIGLSPLHPDWTIDLHIRIASDLHQSFFWPRPARA